MTELEKEFAINQYLCDHIEYDDSTMNAIMTVDLVVYVIALIFRIIDVGRSWLWLVALALILVPNAIVKLVCVIIGVMPTDEYRGLEKNS